MQKITPFLWFDDKAEEAMNFYVSVFKNSKIVSLTRYGEEGPGTKGTVMTGTFQIAGQEFYALKINMVCHGRSFPLFWARCCETRMLRSREGL